MPALWASVTTPENGGGKGVRTPFPRDRPSLSWLHGPTTSRRRRRLWPRRPQPRQTHPHAILHPFDGRWPLNDRRAAIFHVQSTVKLTIFGTNSCRRTSCPAMADGFATNFRSATICPPSLHTLAFVRLAPAPQRDCRLCVARSQLRRFANIGFVDRPAIDSGTGNQSQLLASECVQIREVIDSGIVH